MTTQQEPALYIGLMSGTSMDGTDAILTDLSTSPPRTLAHYHAPYSNNTQTLLEKLVLNSGTPNEIGEADTQIGEHFARCVLELLARSGYASSAIRAIGSHGQTVRHHPETRTAFTLQLGDPNVIAERTGITVVADFRRRDMAAGGQGAPLAPAFHQWCFRHPKWNEAIVNIGGMANVTWLPKGREEPVLGFDTGPGNRLMDSWSQRINQRPYDKGGRWAASGNVISELLEQMLGDSYFQRSGPRSTGREYFNEDWLNSHLTAFPNAEPADVQRTLLALTATSIARATKTAGQPDAFYVCGGGAYNQALMAALAEAMSPCPVQSTEILGMAPQAVEGAAFAWLAMRRLAELPGNLPSVTGASGERILGAIYPG